MNKANDADKTKLNLALAVAHDKSGNTQKTQAILFFNATANTEIYTPLLLQANLLRDRKQWETVEPQPLDSSSFTARSTTWPKDRR